MRPVLRRAFVALALCSGIAPAEAGPDWTGSWDTRWQDGGARMELKQDGAEVHGAYPSYNGTVEGRIEGQVLKGRWSRGRHGGRVDFVMAPDGRSFVGRYDTGEWWTGERVEGKGATVRVRQASPREAMQTFLRAGNTARYDEPDYYARAASVLDFGGGDDAIPPEQKVDRARALFQLVDQTTVRLFTLPDASVAGDEYRTKLPQAGTDAALPLAFVRRDGRWFVGYPDDATLDSARKALLARSGGQFPLPEEYKRRHSARDAMRSFYRSFYEWDAGGAAQARAALDLSQVPEAVRDYAGDLSARYLNGILNRVGIVEPQEIPDDRKSTEPYVVFSHAEGRIIIAPVGTGNDASWKFTDATVARARDIYVVAEDLPPLAGRKLPEPPSLFFDLRRRIRGTAPGLLTQVGDLEAWQIIGWVAVLVVALALGHLLARLMLRLLTPFLVGVAAGGARSTLHWPLWGTLGFSLYKLLIPAIGLPEYAKRFSVGATGTALVVSVVWLGWMLLDAFADRFFSHRDGKAASVDNILVSLAFGFLKLVLIAVGFVLIAVELSLPYEGIIASLSIGGLAVAFASRETLSNVFGAGVLAIDRPFRRGDTISAGGITGTVEHVGVRSTRVRTGEDSVIIMPNGKLADAMVNNLGSRRFHLFQATLPLPYSTTAEQIEALISGARELVDGVPQAAPDRTVVSVSGLSRTGIELSVKYGLDTRKGGDETEITNRLTLGLLRLCERLGVHAEAVA